MDEKRKLTRRSVLKSAALAIGAAFTATRSATSLAQQKASKQAMKYQDKPKGDMRCGNCMQFVSPNACKIVEGTISPNGYCIAWTKKS